MDSTRPQSGNEGPPRRGAIVTGAIKVVATLACVLAVAGAIVTLGGDGEVGESQADITAFGFAPESDTARFVDALDALGHGEPHRYELNGNTIYFSTNQTDDEPMQVLERYQREFVARGINREVYDRLRDDQTMQRTRDGLEGGVVPASIAADHVIMNGVSTPNRARGIVELLEWFGQVATRDGGSPEAASFDAYRAVEIFRERGSAGSTVIATWAKDFEYDKMIPARHGADAPKLDERLPECGWCTLVNQFSDKEAEGLHESYVLQTSHSIEQMRAYYEGAFVAKGWRAPKEPNLFERAKQHASFDGDELQHLHFTRGELSVDVMIYPVEARSTAVRMTLTDGRGPAAPMSADESTNE
jgi:hypothetical protein